MDGQVNLNHDFQEFVELFVAHEVQFLVVGGYALAAHGHPRYTKVPFISIDDFRTNKLATGRPRDLADVADLPPAE